MVLVGVGAGVAASRVGPPPPPHVPRTLFFDVSNPINPPQIPLEPSLTFSLQIPQRKNDSNVQFVHFVGLVRRLYFLVLVLPCGGLGFGLHLVWSRSLIVPGQDSFPPFDSNAVVFAQLASGRYHRLCNGLLHRVWS